MNNYRHEIKMNINYFDKEILSNRLSYLLKKDTNSSDNGIYTVRSLYFENINDTALNDKLSGISYREKFRLRLYNNSCSYIKLEKKVKDTSHGYKKTAILTEEECEALIRGSYGFLLNRQEMVCKELYIKMQAGLFKPRTIVEYTREAYLWEPGMVRITIDSDIKSGLSSTDFLNFKVSMAKALDNNTAILEIKYGGYMPAFISDLLQLDSRQSSSCSKYALCRQLV